MLKRNAFTMVELIFVIVIIGILSATAVPKFTGVKEHALGASELSTASALSTSLSSIHSTWSMSDGDFDWDNDGVDDDIDHELSSKGYPYDLSRNGDPIGALLKSGSKSGFVKQKEGSENGVRYILYTAKASDPKRGVKIPATLPSKDIEGKPDKNDFWLYVVEANATNTSCHVYSDRSNDKIITSGDFLLIDINNTLPINFNDSNLGINFTLTCS